MIEKIFKYKYLLKSFCFQGYKGCFIDSEHRALPIQVLLPNNLNSPEVCILQCRLIKKTYAGVQSRYVARNDQSLNIFYFWDFCMNINIFFLYIKSDQCFCGNQYGSHGTAPETDCNMQCNGDSSKICGGSWRNSVYKV